MLEIDATPVGHPVDIWPASQPARETAQPRAVCEAAISWQPWRRQHERGQKPGREPFAVASSNGQAQLMVFTKAKRVCCRCFVAQTLEKNPHTYTRISCRDSRGTRLASNGMQAGCCRCLPPLNCLRRRSKG